MNGSGFRDNEWGLAGEISTSGDETTLREDNGLNVADAFRTLACLRPRDFHGAFIVDVRKLFDTYGIVSYAGNNQDKQV